MYIVDRNTDFYDYLSKIYGIDKGIIFDRRGSERIDDEFLSSGIDSVNSVNYHYSSWRSTSKEGWFVLEIGTIQYLIKIFDVENKKDESFKSCKMKVLRVFNNNINQYGFPISIKKIRIPWIWGRKEEEFIKNGKFKELVKIDYTYKTIINPILAKTQLTKLIDPEEIWKSLANYISSLNNDKDISIPMTDVEKAINHGFDKRTSFRHPVK